MTVTAGEDRERRRSQPRRPRALALSVAAICLAAAILASFDAASNGRIVDSQGRLETQTLVMARGERPVSPSRLIDPSLPPRALVHEALIHARAADGEHDSERRGQLLREADRAATIAAAARPHWGEAEVVLAYAQSLRTGVTANATLSFIEQSYRSAPYLRHAGPWRAEVALVSYARLSPTMRERVVNEAVFLARRGRPEREAMFAAARQSAGYAAFLQHWHLTRRGDADRANVDRSLL